MKRTLLTIAMLSSLVLTHGQRTPEHPFDFENVNFDNFRSYFPQWQAGTPPGQVSQMDDEFYKSRVRPLKRIEEGDYQVNSSVDRNRKMCLWVPLDDPSTKWKSLPRYCFEGDNFSMWSYVDIHGNWTAPWMRSTAGISDVAAKNGVKVGTLWSIPWAANVSLYGYNEYALVLKALLEKQGNSYKHAKRLVELMKYYGINGLGVNSEFSSNQQTMTEIQKFFAECHKEAAKINWDFQLYWYDLTGDQGQIIPDQGLDTHNDAMFGEAGNIVTDMLFFNYNWYGNMLKSSQQKAEQMGRSSYDLYAGFDIQGRALNNNNWTSLLNNKISIGFWGAHAQSLIHQSSTDAGTADIAIQNTYLKKQELIFSGGYRNPGLLPAIRNNSTLSNADLQTFHGLATFISAKSTIQQLPFVSRFNLGNGLKFYNEGKVTFNHKWYNLNTQDFMPTWRWWITDATDQVTTANVNSLVKADLVFDDAYFGGSCLSLHGATAFSRVKLFKTLLKVKANNKLSVTYKMTGNAASHAKLFVALKDNVNSYKEIDIPAAANVGEWNTFTTTLDQLGIADDNEIAMIGISVNNTPADYNMYVGEIAVRDPQKTFAPIAPQIKEVEILRGRYNQLDFKMRYASKEETGNQKYYNDEVDTWYYEIFFQEENGAEQLLTATTSWAAYVIDAPLTSRDRNRQGRFGVRAVSPDGTTKSDITWSEYKSIPYDQPLTDVVIDKPVVKPNETFKVGFLDEMADPAQEWKIVNPVTNETVASANNATSCTLSIAQEGLYDLEYTNAAGQTVKTRGFVQISPEATGAVPQVTNITTNKTKAATGEEIQYTYTGKKGEGKVSRALEIKDPNRFQIPGDVQSGKDYTYALWVKVNKFSHDKQGTNLIDKNSIADKWPHNNWGDLWVTIRPEYQGTSELHPANEVSFNVMGWEAHDTPNELVMTSGYSITPGVWAHVAVTHTNGNIQAIYFNGKKIKETTFGRATRRENMSDSRINKRVVADIFIGGGGVYKAGLDGWIDDVQVWNRALSETEIQQAMKGYDKANVPEGLQAYYTFEEKNADQSFPNLGKAGDKPGKVVVVSGSGGESTSSASYTTQEANNDVLGYPGLTGTLDINTAAEWTLSDADVVSKEGEVATVKYQSTGKYDAGVTLKNRWGEASKTVNQIIEITGEATAIDGVDATLGFAVYPNPFVESVNLRFAEAGRYIINVLNAGGAVLQQNSIEATPGLVANVAIKGTKGLYLVQVLKDGKVFKTVKVVKK